MRTGLGYNLALFTQSGWKAETELNWLAGKAEAGLKLGREGQGWPAIDLLIAGAGRQGRAERIRDKPGRTKAKQLPIV
ncbi:hypothetical protein PPACK8108_LOCUS11824 [Phakopsora pachyrhizi]|uniref:Uncharacterized protein n=1 Tax=Phakopsora pachyrhizi TaxID=170000 RepID=A0AAV0B2S4_PHAPC|nr:hypothetical protein PPACK8108_LOCUS11824 [Phakopsora pachyrhizi]